MSDIVMPKLSDSMEQGLVLHWLVDEGQPVEVGQDLAEIESDKATMTYQSEVAGILSIVVPAGLTVAVGEVVARVGAAVAQDQAAALHGPLGDERPRTPSGQARNGSAAITATTAALSNPGRATPLARRIASACGVAIETLQGTGPRGRITKADVLRATGQPSPPPATPVGTLTDERAPATLPVLEPSFPVPAPAPVRESNGSGRGERRELTRLQQLIARRMSQAKATIPHFQVQTEADVTDLLSFRRELKAVVEQRGRGQIPSVNDLIVKACAIALSHHPRANGSYSDGHFELHEHVNIGIAVAADDALVVPTIFNADTKSLGQIAVESHCAAERVRTAQITPPELSGGTFTVSNLGMYGMTAITPVINPPQAAILGVGAIRESLARRGDEIVDRSLVTLTLSCDHRILYGADAATFLAEIRDLLEHPHSLSL